MSYGSITATLLKASGCRDMKRLPFSAAITGLSGIISRFYILMVAELASSTAGMEPGIQTAWLFNTDSTYCLSYWYVDATFLDALEISEHILARCLFQFKYSQVAQMLFHVVLVARPTFENPTSVFFFAPFGQLQDGLIR